MLFFSQKSGDPLAEFLLVVQIAVQNCVDVSSRDVSSLCLLFVGLSSIFGQQQFHLLNPSHGLRPLMVFVSVRCLPRSSDLERVETISEQFSLGERCFWRLLQALCESLAAACPAGTKNFIIVQTLECSSVRKAISLRERLVTVASKKYRPMIQSLQMPHKTVTWWFTWNVFAHPPRSDLRACLRRSKML